MIFVTNPEDVDRIEDMWMLSKEDADRLPVADRKRNYLPILSGFENLLLSQSGATTCQHRRTSDPSCGPQIMAIRSHHVCRHLPYFAKAAKPCMGRLVSISEW